MPIMKPFGWDFQFVQIRLVQLQCQTQKGLRCLAQVDLHRKAVEVCWTAWHRHQHIWTARYSKATARENVLALAAGKAGRWKRSICLRASLNEQQSETCLRRDAECQPQAVIGGDCLMFLRSFKAAHVDHCIKRSRNVIRRHLDMMQGEMPVAKHLRNSNTTQDLCKT